MSKDPDFSYYNADGRKVSGSAAFNHHVFTEIGGIKNYNDAIGAMYIQEFVKQHSENINTEYSAKVKRGRIRRVS